MRETKEKFNTGWGLIQDPWDEVPLPWTTENVLVLLTLIGVPALVVVIGYLCNA
jgi:hypothetical protein